MNYTTNRVSQRNATGMDIDERLSRASVVGHVWARLNLLLFRKHLLPLLTTFLAVLVCRLAWSDTPMEPEYAQPLPTTLHRQHTARSAPNHPLNAILAIELSEATLLRAKDGSRRGGPTEIGVGRELPQAYQGDLAPQLTWGLHADGGYVAVLEITSPGAKGMRAGIRALATDGVTFRFFDPGNTGAAFPSYVPESKTGYWGDVQVYWTPTIHADRLRIEIYAPNWNAASALRLEIERISHLFSDALAPQSSPRATPEPQSGQTGCRSIPAACGRSSSCTVAATAKLIFVRSDGHSYVCTGTVINDDRDTSDKSNNAFLHTAYHCINSQGAAQSLEAEFHYADAGCHDSRLDSRYGRYYGGADLLEAAQTYDQSLIRLRQPLSVGGVCFSGWDPNRRPVGTAILGVHHPRGSRKEWLAGNLRAYELANFKNLGVVEGVRLEYMEGHTKGGSSGSGFFLDNGNDTHFLLGSLVGGPEDDCTVGYYGSLRDFYPRIRPYLRNESPPPADDDHGNARGDASEVAVNTVVSGSLESPDDVDYFSFTIDGDGELTIESSGSTDTIGTLYDADGRQLQWDDDGGSAYNFSLSMDLAPGTYYLSVSGYQGEVGHYQLSVTFVAAPVYSRAIPLMLSADEVRRQGFLRIQNYSEDDEITLVITAIDDWGDRFGPIDYRIEPFHSIHFNSNDIERGNPSKGLHNGFGDGRGWWRLQLRSSTPIFATSYVRTADGFLTSIHDTALDLELDGTLFLVPLFNPASNVNQRSWLRITNLSTQVNKVSVTGLDDAGERGSETVRFSIRGSQSVHLNSKDLESGIPDIDSGSFGNGVGKWQLIVQAQEPIRVASLMVTPTGHITNLSTVNFNTPNSEELVSRAVPQLDSYLNRLNSGQTTTTGEYPILLPRHTGPR